MVAMFFDSLVHLCQPFAPTLTGLVPVRMDGRYLLRRCVRFPRIYTFMALPQIDTLGHVLSLDFVRQCQVVALLFSVFACGPDRVCIPATSTVATGTERTTGATIPRYQSFGLQDDQASNRSGGIFIADGEHYTIQAAIDAAHAAGGGTVLVAKDTPVSDSIRLKDGVLLFCAWTPDYNAPITYHGGRIIPVPGFAPEAVIVADPSNVKTVAAFITGVGIENCTIDMSNISTSGRIAIELRSVSNSGPFRNITVVNQDDGQYLYVGRSKNIVALASEGITFEDFYALSKTADPKNSSPAVIVEEANEITFLGARTKIMRHTLGSPAEGSVGIVVRSNGPAGSNHITFDGMSVVGYETHISVQRHSGKVAPRWVRVLGCTFEVFNRGIELSGDE